MSTEENYLNKKENIKCADCTTFYASEAYGGLCSSCYKYTLSLPRNSKYQKKEQKIEEPPSNASTPATIAEKELVEEMEELTLEPVKKEQVDRKRCFCCRKKVGLLGIECKCGFVYCNGHRLPENHECDYDHKERGKDKLRTEVVKVAKSKIEGI